MFNRKAKNSKKLEDVARLYANSDKSLATIEILKKELGADYTQQIKLIEQANQGDFTGVANYSGLWKTLEKLSHLLSTGKRSNLLYQYNEFDQERRSLGKIFSGFVLKNGAYCFALIWTLFTILTTYKIKIIPIFNSFFTDFGTPLPALTVAVMGSMSFIYLVVFILLLLLFLYFILVTWLRRRVTKILPLSYLILYIPIIGRIAAQYNYYVYLTYYQMIILANNGLIDISSKLLQQIKIVGYQNERKLIETAYRLGTVTNEIVFHKENVFSRMKQAIELSLKVVFIFYFLLIILIIATFVIAMYLPIFMLGDVVG